MNDLEFQLDYVDVEVEFNSGETKTFMFSDFYFNPRQWYPRGFYRAHNFVSWFNEWPLRDPTVGYEEERREELISYPLYDEISMQSIIVFRKDIKRVKQITSNYVL
jgi:hypothetical protein